MQQRAPVKNCMIDCLLPALVSSKWPQTEWPAWPIYKIEASATETRSGTSCPESSLQVDCFFDNALESEMMETSPKHNGFGGT